MFKAMNECFWGCGFSWYDYHYFKFVTCGDRGMCGNCRLKYLLEKLED